jgi:hypothetical protein
MHYQLLNWPGTPANLIAKIDSGRISRVSIAQAF